MYILILELKCLHSDCKAGVNLVQKVSVQYNYVQGADIFNLASRCPESDHYK